MCIFPLIVSWAAATAPSSIMYFQREEEDSSKPKDQDEKKMCEDVGLFYLFIFSFTSRLSPRSKVG